MALEIKTHRSLKVEYNPKTKLVFENGIAIGVIRKKEIFPLDEKAITICKKYGVDYLEKDSEEKEVENKDLFLKIDPVKLNSLMEETAHLHNCCGADHFFSIPLEVRDTNLLLHVPCSKKERFHMEDLGTHRVFPVSDVRSPTVSNLAYLKAACLKVEFFLKNFYLCEDCKIPSIYDKKIKVCEKCFEKRKKLEIFTFGSNILMECSICKEKIHFDFQKNENENCKHIFHYKCLAKMKKKKFDEDDCGTYFTVDCPLCKGEFKVY